MGNVEKSKKTNEICCVSNKRDIEEIDGMTTTLTQRDNALKARLERLAAYDKDYWSFKGNSRREHGHGFFQYPAMMVPQVTRAILDETALVYPEMKCIGDPFAGSGTILTESMRRGLNFTGQDINPLAVLLCRAKSGPFFPEALKEKSEELNQRIKNDGKVKIDIDFPGRSKWFQRDVQFALSKIRRAIRKEPAVWARRFFWVALAEAVRLTSNSRTSTFKLHIRTKENIEERDVDTIAIFRKALERNLEHLQNQTDFLNKNNYLQNGHYVGDVEVSLGDIRNRDVDKNRKCDLIITSPPYGDNTTTVPYGQYSFLPLQWIDLEDIDETIDRSAIQTTHTLDSHSLGGSLKLDEKTLESLSERSESFKRFVSRIKDLPKDRTKRVASFFRDLDSSLTPIVDSLNPGGLMVWILGNRRVGGYSVPLDKILAELLELKDVSILTSLTRKIYSKRMALKNSIARLMSSEIILVMRKAIPDEQR